MPISFQSTSQQQLFDALIQQLTGLGYVSGELLKKEYAFRDYLSPSAERRIVPAATFGQTPCAYDSACFAILLGDNSRGPERLPAIRALGAPKAFEVHDDIIVQWNVTTHPSESDLQLIIPSADVRSVFSAFQDDWKPSSILRLKNIGAAQSYQRELIDYRLIPLIESHIKQLIDPLLRRILSEARAEFEERTKSPIDYNGLVRLLFRALAGKVMHDRRHPGFVAISERPDAAELLDKVARHYNDNAPTTDDPCTQQLVVDRLWESFGFENLSAEVLAFVWETTLVTDNVREAYGIHATPPSIAKYIVQRMPFERLRPDDRRIIEPCCGSGTFLIAALHRLRDLLPPSHNPLDRHRYFVKMLSGFDIESFGLEVAKSCLMLADFPYPNGWKLYREDVFGRSASPTFLNHLREASAVLCNPPFESFTDRERRACSPQSEQKPAELLTTVLRETAPSCMLGFVLPTQALDGAGYRDVRRALATRYGGLEVVSLPDNVFAHAEHESVLLIANEPAKSQSHVSIIHRRVAESQRDEFLATHAITTEDTDSRLFEDAATSLSVVELHKFWKSLTDLQRLKSVARISRGIEWQPPFDVFKYVSQHGKHGYVRGLLNVRGKHATPFPMFRAPASCVYLSTIPEHRRGNAFDLPWNKPKVIMNAVRRSRGVWRATAFTDDSGLAVSQNFHGIWPISDWSPSVICAVLNGYVAAAYISTHSPRKHITKRVLADLPLPALDTSCRGALDELVREYAATAPDASVFSKTEQRRALDVLAEIDAIVLVGYGLSGIQHRELLSFFERNDGKRPVDPPCLPPAIAIQKIRNQPAMELLNGWKVDVPPAVNGCHPVDQPFREGE